MTFTRERVAVFTGIAIVAAVALAIAYGPIGSVFERVVSGSLNAFARHIHNGAGLNGASLYLAAFAGGLLASISPCILGLLPVNLSYIGASRVKTRGEAAQLATLFVAGVAVTTMAVGLVASLFFALFVTYRAQVNIGVGLLIVLMAIWMSGLVRVPLPSAVKRMPAGGPFVVGLVYALVASPCASPVLVAVLGAASASGSPVTSVVTMAVYAVGYSAVLWLASLFAGIVIASRRLLAYGEVITRAGAAALFVLGLGFVLYGATQV